MKKFLHYMAIVADILLKIIVFLLKAGVYLIIGVFTIFSVLIPDNEHPYDDYYKY